MKLFLVLTMLTVLFATSKLDVDKPKYKTYYNHPVQAQTVAIAAEPVPDPPTYHRGYTELQNQPCRPAFTNSHYTSELISKREMVDAMSRLGIPSQYHDTMAAIAHAESGSQLSCFGDDTKPYYLEKTKTGDTWLYSIGLFQIRLLQNETGTGKCRDEKRLANNLDQQILCAWEISGYGKSWSPWSVTHANRGYPYKKWLGKSW